MKKLIILSFISINCFGQILSESEMRSGLTNILNLGKQTGTEKRDKLLEYIQTRVTKEAAGKFAQEIESNKTVWAKLFYSKFTTTTVKGIVADMKTIADGSYGHRALDDEKIESVSEKKKFDDLVKLYESVNNEIRAAYIFAFIDVSNYLDGVNIPEKTGSLEDGFKSVLFNGLDALTDAIPLGTFSKGVLSLAKDAIIAVAESDSEAEAKYKEEYNEAMMTNKLKKLLADASSAAGARFSYDKTRVEAVLKSNALKYGKNYFDNLSISLTEYNKLATKRIGISNYQNLFFRFELLESLINKIGPLHKDGFIIVETRLNGCGSSAVQFLNYLTDIKEDCPNIVRARYAIHGSMSTQFTAALNALFLDFKKAEDKLAKKPSDMNISFLYRIHPPQRIGFDGYLTIPVTRKNGVIKISGQITMKKGGFYNDTSDRNPTDEEILESEFTNNTIGPKLLPIITYLNSISNRGFYSYGPTTTGKTFALDEWISPKTKREGAKQLIK